MTRRYNARSDDHRRSRSERQSAYGYTTRRKTPADYKNNRVVTVRCARCHRRIAWLGDLWIELVYGRTGQESACRYCFLGHNSKFPTVPVNRGLKDIALDSWHLSGVECACGKVWDLNLHRMSSATGVDGRKRDLIQGLHDYGLPDIGPELEYRIKSDLGIEDAELQERFASPPTSADLAALRSRIRSRARRKTWPGQGMVNFMEELHTGDPADRA
jgi:hypothetical protein